MTDLQLSVLRESLAFFRVEELREVAKNLCLSDKGSKISVIMRILHFKKTGEKLTASKFPSCSCSKRGEASYLELPSLMLKGSYKNDLKTRLFFKKVIGEYFHFTAFGIDWLNERWMLGNPPTYQEFADMWKDEYEKRQKIPASPKEEWAYIKFMQYYLTNSLDTTRSSLNVAWENERQRHKSIVKAILAIAD